MERLAELALDLQWSWNHRTDDIWERLDAALWARTHNPWIVLQSVSRARLELPWPTRRSCRPWTTSSNRRGAN